MIEPCNCTCGNRYCASNRKSTASRGNPKRRKKYLTEANKKLSARKQANSVEAAKRYYDEWTQAEIETVSRSDISAKEMSEITGRTYYAVKSMRKKLSTKEEQA